MVDEDLVNSNSEVFSKVQSKPWRLFMVCVAKVSRVSIRTVSDSVDALFGAVACVPDAGQ